MGVLTKQNQATALNGIHGNYQTEYTSTDGWHSHGYSYPYTRSGVKDTGLIDSGCYALEFTSSSTGGDGNHSHSVSFTPNISSNDTETRPDNYSVRIWKRIA